MSPDQNGAPADDTLCMCEVCEIHRREDAEHAAVHARAEAALASAERMANGLPPFQVGDIVRETRNDAWGDVDAPVVRVCKSGVVVMAHPVRGEGGFEPHTLRLVTPAPPEPVMPESWFEVLLDNLTRETAGATIKVRPFTPLRDFFSFMKPQPEPIYMYGFDPASPDGDAPAYVVGRARPAGGLNIDDVYLTSNPAPKAIYRYGPGQEYPDIASARKAMDADNEAAEARRYSDSYYRQWRAPPEVVDFYAGEQWGAKVLYTIERKRETWRDVVWGRPLDIPWRPGKMGSPAFKEAQQAWNKASSDTVAAMASEPTPAKALDSLDGLTSAQRKNVPIATGVIDYFPDAIAAVAAVSKAGSEQHHPGEPLHWDRSKSADEADCLMRHFVDRGKFDTCGHRHSAKVAWRALALLQKEIETDAEVEEDMAFYRDLVGDSAL